MGDTPAPNNQQFTVNNVLNSGVWDSSILATTNWLDALGDDVLNFGLEPDFNVAAIGETTLFQQHSPEVLRDTHSEPSTAVTHPTAQSDETEAGEYYVDGQPARLPHVKRRRTISLADSGAARVQPSGSTLKWWLEDARGSVSCIALPDETYEQIVSAYHCRGLTDAQNAQHNVPSRTDLEHFLYQYWQSFNSTLPLTHPELIRPTDNLVLTVAMCAIGSHYTDAPAQHTISLHESVHRMLLDHDKVHGFTHDEPSVATARLLLYIGTTCCRDGMISSTASVRRELLCNSFASAPKTFTCNDLPDAGPSYSWETWLVRERAIRIVYSAWLLDTMYASRTQEPSLLSLQDATLPLPCNEKLWEARTKEEWQALFAFNTASPSLQEALHELYIDKRLPIDRGEFARILMIHGLYHRLWQVGRYYSDPLSTWEPTARREASSEVLPRQPVWLPSVPAFAKWQNSTCDVLDILHWQANATIGQASGFEHPTVFHLHFARVMLLAPCDHIVTLAKFRASGYNIDRIIADQAAQQVQRWAVQHQYKARLAAVHAGVLFWHVRRYSVDGFYEAPAVALAALMLWAFGMFATRHARSGAESLDRQPSHSGQTSTAGHEPALGTEDDAVCNIILLDRPTDDELVQQFIKQGHTMQAHITGVGDLYTAKGPNRVLAQGCKLLSSLKYWGISSTWLVLLQRLATLLAMSTSEGADFGP